MHSLQAELAAVRSAQQAERGGGETPRMQQPGSEYGTPDDGSPLAMSREASLARGGSQEEAVAQLRGKLAATQEGHSARAAQLQGEAEELGRRECRARR